MERDYIEKNRAEYSRLKRLLHSLDETTWKHRIDDHWKVGTMFWHLAFWDQMTFERLNTWKSKGILPAIPDPENIDAINASFRGISEWLDLNSGLSHIPHYAENIDALVARFSAEDLKTLQDSGKERWFMRYRHRSEHLNRIEDSLNRLP